jgi:dCMP deaminase
MSIIQTSQQILNPLRPSWDQWYVDLAAFVAQRSRDPSTKVGAVIVRPDKTVASIGFNGFPRGIEDKPELLANRDEKYPRTIHAELNAILTANEPLDGYSIYCTLHPCAECAACIIQKRIARVVAFEPSENERLRWGRSFVIAKSMLSEAGITVTLL